MEFIEIEIRDGDGPVASRILEELGKVHWGIHQLREEQLIATKEARETNRLLDRLICILRKDQSHDNVEGGSITRIGDSMNQIAPGSTVKFLVTPTFSGAPFALNGAQAAVTSSDPANFPVSLDLAGDPTGATFESVIPATATPTGGSEDITVTWTYTNADGHVATVSGTVTEVGIVDDVTGGTFAQVA
jgi:hypothetical protein